MGSEFLKIGPWLPRKVRSKLQVLFAEMAVENRVARSVDFDIVCSDYDSDFDQVNLGRPISIFTILFYGL